MTCKECKLLKKAHDHRVELYHELARDYEVLRKAIEKVHRCLEEDITLDIYVKHICCEQILKKALEGDKK